MANQYEFGIEGLTEDEVCALSPRRITEAGLRRQPNAELLRLRNIVQREQSCYQSFAHAQRVSERLSRIEAEMDRRGLSQWLARRCPDCGERPELTVAGGELLGACRCTKDLNMSFRSTICVGRVRNNDQRSV